MKDSAKFSWAAVIVFIAWALGFFWHPFGYATWVWHVILWIIIIFLVCGYYYCLNKEKD